MKGVDGTCSAPARLALHVLWTALMIVMGVESAGAQDAKRILPDEDRTRTVAPGPEYGAGWLHRMVFGAHYRNLWTSPIDVPVLDLRSFAGGLTPLKRGGFGQTTSLHLTTSDGRRFVFRSVNKDPSRGLPSLFRGTFVDDILQDQISALHPDAALIAAPLLQAVGVLHAEPQLYVMPDDPLLGEFRSEFAGMLAVLEERPDEAEDDEPGFAESRRIVSTDRLFDRLEASPKNRVDAEDFLAARLMDLFLGDRDRHADQWRWARFPDGDDFKWRAIPRDRDQAFFALGGLVARISRFWTPQFVSFSDEYPNLVWATWNGRGLDRRLLIELRKPTWDSVAAAVQAKLTDSVIETAVRLMPSPHYAQRGPELERLLKQRRDKLHAMADRYYRLLARHADIHATDKNEVAEFTRLGDDVELRVYRRRKNRELSDDDRYVRRLFHRSETKEIRLFMHGGDDSVVVRGDVDRSILLHIVGGGGDDVFVDSSVVRSAHRQTRVYDSRGDNEFVVGSGTMVDQEEETRDPETERFAAPEPTGPFGVHSRNWGHWWRPTVWLGAEPDVGLFVGGGAALYAYGFRKVPYKFRLTMGVGYAFGAERPRAELRLESPSLARTLQGAVVVRASGIDLVNFHGFGNETPELDDDFVRVRQEQYTLEPSLTLLLSGPTGRGATMASERTDPVPPSLALTFGPLVKVARTEPDPTVLIGQLRPRGINTFGQVGVSLAIQYDGRDRLLAASRGLYFQMRGELYPPLLTVSSTYGKLAGEVATYLTPAIGDRAPTLAVRAGAEKVWGAFPFFESAFVGGAETLRGFRNQRFAGESSVYGGAEVRVPLGGLSVIVPGEIGVFGFTDVGRVFLSGENSDRWHVGGGGGVWLSLLARANTVSVGLAGSAEQVALYAGAGFGF